MPVSLVLTVIGDDKPGLVEMLADTIAAHEGNWLESRMAHLVGKFAGVLRIEAPSDRVQALTQALEALEGQGLRVVSEPTGVEESGFRTVHLDVVGSDQSGIVRDIFRALAGLGVNVEDLETERTDAPMSGQALFRANAKLQLPPSVDLEVLSDRLEGVAQDLMVDLTLDDLADA